MGQKALAIDPAKVCLFIPPELKKFKLELFDRIARKIHEKGGRFIRGDHTLLKRLPKDIIPIVGCTPQLRGMIGEWRQRGRTFIYWDRGYCRRVFATWLPRGENGGYYRWHLNAFQLRQVRDLPDDRWKRMETPVLPWRREGKHVVIANPTATYAAFHGLKNWTQETLDILSRSTKRQIVIRDKETRRPLQDDLRGAHALVAHGSIAAVEAVICGCPVFVHPDSAAALVGSTDLNMIEKPRYPDRMRWLNSLAYSQFNETELVDGTLWQLIS